MDSTYNSIGFDCKLLERLIFNSSEAVRTPNLYRLLDPKQKARQNKAEMKSHL